MAWHDCLEHAICGSVYLFFCCGEIFLGCWDVGRRARQSTCTCCMLYCPCCSITMSDLPEVR